MSAIDVEHLRHQISWSAATFGHGSRTKGLIAHIQKELEEIERDPHDLYEWVDVIILGFDGAWRSGHTPEEIIAAIKDKQARNEKRRWPDPSSVGEDEAIEHVRD